MMLMITLLVLFVELAQELAALDPMMDVLLRLLSVQSMDTVNVAPTHQEDQHADLELTQKEVKGELLVEMLLLVVQLQEKCVELDKEPVVLDLMMVVHQKLQSALSMDTANVVLINQGDQHVDPGLTNSEIKRSENFNDDLL